MGGLLFWQPQPDCKFPNSAVRRLGPFHCALTRSFRTVPVLIRGDSQQNKKPPDGWFVILAAQIENNANEIIQDIINIAEILTDADVLLYEQQKYQ